MVILLKHLTWLLQELYVCLWRREPCCDVVMDLCDKLLDVYVLAVRVHLVIVLPHAGVDLELHLYLVLLDSLVDQVHELLLEKELSVHVKAHLLCYLIL